MNMTTESIEERGQLKTDSVWPAQLHLFDTNVDITRNEASAFLPSKLMHELSNSKTRN